MSSYRIFQYIEFKNSPCNDIFIHLYNYMYVFVYTIKMFYVCFIINMTYNTHNRTTLLKQPKSNKKSTFEMICVIHLCSCSNVKGKL